MQFFIDANTSVKKVHNFWNHIHFHPTDAIEDAWGQRILDRVALDGAAQTVRMYAMLEDIVTISPDGKLQYDFSLNDTRLDYMLSKGFDILLSYNFIPPCIAADPEELATVCKNKTRYKGKFIITSPPKSYALWEEICREYTRHIVQRYGIEVVSKWELQCYNEPDISCFFMRDETDIQKRAAEYCKLYDAFETGVLSVSRELCIGGPALAMHLEFLEYFLNHVKRNSKRLDFICYHTYGPMPYQVHNGSRPIHVRNTFEKAEMVRAVAKKCGFPNTRLIADEWGAIGHGFVDIEEYPQMIFREKAEYAAYFVKMLTLLDQQDFTPDKMLICLSGQHEMTRDFSGFRNLFTLNFFPKPLYHAYTLSAKLGCDKLACDKPYADTTYSIFPTRREDGSVAVLFAHCADDFSDIAEEGISLTFHGIQGNVRLWKIDCETANAYTAFLKIGAPKDLSAEQIRHIQERAACRPVEIGSLPESQIVQYTAKPNSVTLVEIFPQD